MFVFFTFFFQGIFCLILITSYFSVKHSDELMSHWWLIILCLQHMNRIWMPVLSKEQISLSLSLLLFLSLCLSLSTVHAIGKRSALNIITGVKEDSIHRHTIILHRDLLQVDTNILHNESYCNPNLIVTICTGVLQLIVWVSASFATFSSPAYAHDYDWTWDRSIMTTVFDFYFSRSVLANISSFVLRCLNWSWQIENIDRTSYVLYVCLCVYVWVFFGGVGGV